MNKPIDDGGPAYPSVLYKQEPTENSASDGMSLRDYFAGQALAGLVGGYTGNAEMGGVSPRMWADEAYQYADAMLLARKGGA